MTDSLSAWMGSTSSATFDPSTNVCEGPFPVNIRPLENASACGDLHTVKLTFESLWFGREFSSKLKTKHFVGALHEAVQNDHPVVVDYLLCQGVPPEMRFFQYAVQNKSYRMLEVFLKHNWNINKEMSYCNPPLLADTFDDLSLTRWFLAHGADPNARCMFDTTPLSRAVRDASLETITLLFDYGGSVEHGELLHWAIYRPSDDYLDVVKLLLRKGAPINLLKYQNDKSSWSWWKSFNLGTPLHTAAKRGRLDVVEELLANGADPSIRDSCGELALDTARYENHGAVVQRLQSACDTSTDVAHKL